MADFYSNSIFWVDIDKIRPNPYQPRREFEEGALKDLAESIRLYGVMQPLTVSRVEREKPEGGIAVEYELIAGERRMRASKLAGLIQVPVIIRVGDTSQEKLELAIIENLQRSDLNPVERAHAFARLAAEFKLQHSDIGKKMGRSREYVSNTLRILALPQEMLDALASGRITEGHTRPLLMLTDRPEEQMVLFKEILNKKVTVRDAERAARNIAVDRARKAPRQTDPVLREVEESLQKMLGERVRVEQDAVGGRVTISFLNPEELRSLIDQLQPARTVPAASAPAFAPAHVPTPAAVSTPTPVPVQAAAPAQAAVPTPAHVPAPAMQAVPVRQEQPVRQASAPVTVPAHMTATPAPVAAAEKVAAPKKLVVQVPQVFDPKEALVEKAELKELISEAMEMKDAAPAAPASMQKDPTPALDESDLYSINSFSL